MGTARAAGRRFLILGGGPVLDYTAVAGEMLPGDFVICADSGYRHCGPLGVEADLLVGDFDSIEGGIPAGIPLRRLPSEKDFTDTAHALEEAMARGAETILIAGALGGRLDHTLGNIQSLAGLSRRGIDARLTDGVTYVAAVTDGTLILPRRANCYFSLFPQSGVCRGVTIRGARYGLKQADLTFDLPRAVSNEFLEGDAVVSVEEGTLVIVTTPMETTME